MMHTPLPPMTDHASSRHEERFLTLHDPATGQALPPIMLASVEEVDRAVTSARRFFDQTGYQTSLAERIIWLEELLNAIDRRKGAFADIISREVGSPIDFSRAQQVEAALHHLRASLHAARSLPVDEPVNAEQPAHRTRYEASGVAALITPWNWPLNQIALKLAGALIAGCSLVIKPSELTPGMTRLLEDCVKHTSIPEGALHFLIGDGETGRALVNHPDIDIVSFTGSTPVGREIARAAAGHFKRVVLELGGKSPNLLFADCNLEIAMTQGLAHCFRNAGQSCNAAARMLVERSIYEQAIALAGCMARSTRVDYPDREGGHIGPLISQQQYERVQAYIETGLRQGARLVAGGTGHPDGLSGGYFVRPTVFADVTPDMTIFREEIFGPVLTLTPFADEEEAIGLANDTPYGLAGYIQTGVAERANRVAKRLRVGMVQVNGASRVAGAAFGGIKASGIGREAGLWGIRAFQEVKSISGVADL